jgi:formylglycine-generating enzyme required for sulfatase activity
MRRLLVPLLFASILALPASAGAEDGAGNPKPEARLVPQAGTRFRDCASCPEMIVAPSGTFTIGSPEDEAGRREDEGPLRKVVIDRPLAVARFEITRREYETFVEATGHPASGNCVTDRKQSGHWSADPDTNFRDPGFAQTDDHPVACVSWKDAKAYIAWLNSRTGGGYRLLTEAEWEFLARAGSASAYPWGRDVDGGCAYMNGYDRTILRKKGNLYEKETPPFAACDDGHVNTAPVGSFKPNAFGIHDMIGNLGEWVEDCATASYAGLRPDGTHEGEADCARRMVRGGSWGTMPRQLRSAERIRYAPTDVDDSIGIRVAKDLDRPPSKGATARF